MLKFLRKQQRLLFIIVSIFVITSFCFFGTYSTIRSTDVSEDKLIGIAIDGSKIWSREVHRMSTFILTDQNDLLLLEKGILPNGLNDGVLKKDFLTQKWALPLVMAYREDLKEEMVSRIEKIQRFVPYRHPTAPFISLEALWGHFNPKLLSTFNRLKEMEGDLTDKTSETFIDLYLEQSTLHPEMLRRILFQQESQFSWVEKDMNLYHVDLSLGGLHNAEEWFGRDFIELISLWIINTSKIAKEKGITVSSEEAKADLLKNAASSYEILSQNKVLEVSSPLVLYKELLRSLKMTEREAIETWKNVMQCRRLLQNVGEIPLLDLLTFKEINSFAEEKVEVDLYELPKELQAKNFREMLKIETYFETIYDRPATLLSLTSTIPNIKEIEISAPSLIVRPFVVEMAEVDSQSIGLKIGLKELWEWQAMEAHFNMLKAEFPTIAASQEQEGRLEILDGFDRITRKKIDDFSRKVIVKTHPEWIREVLDTSPLKEVQFSLRIEGGQLPFKGVENQEEFAALLLGEKGDALDCFTFDGEHYYRVKVKERPSQKQVLSLQEALQDGTLDELLDKKLEANYPEIRKKTPSLFKQEDGAWKPFEEVKDLISTQSYAPLLKSIEQEVGHPSLNGLDTYARFHFLGALKEAKNEIEKNQDIGGWNLEKRRVTFSRKSIQDEKDKLAFSLPVDNWSSVICAEKGYPSFLYVCSKSKGESFPPDLILRGQELLSQEAQMTYIKELTEEMKKKEAISLSHKMNP